LEDAHKQLPESESVLLARQKLEKFVGNFEVAGDVLKEGREKIDTERVWMQSAILCREEGKDEEALAICDQAIQKFPSFHKLWLIKA